MKKFLIINLILLTVVLAISEIYSYFIVKNTIGDYYDIFNEQAKKNNTSPMSLRYNFLKEFNQNDYKFLERNISYGKNKNKKSVLFFGCSYTYGSNVEEKDTMPYLVSEQTGRTTVNKAIPGASILNSLLVLLDEDFYGLFDKINEPEYIVYTFINDHLGRITSLYKVMFIQDNNKYELMPEFEVKDNSVSIKKRSKILYPFYHLYTAKALSYYYSYNLSFSKQRNEKMFELLNAAKMITDEKFKNSKFVVIVYKDGSHSGMDRSLWEKLENSGFIMLDAEELAGHELESLEWRGEDKEHPNPAAFRDVSKGLIKALNL